MKVNPVPTAARVGTTGAAHSHAGAAGALGCAAGQGVRISSALFRAVPRDGRPVNLSPSTSIAVPAAASK